MERLSPQTRYALKWGFIVGIILAHNWRCHKDGIEGNTLCETGRWLLHTRTRIGHWAFIGILYGFYYHIMHPFGEGKERANRNVRSCITG